MSTEVTPATSLDTSALAWNQINNLWKIALWYNISGWNHLRSSYKLTKKWNYGVKWENFGNFYLVFVTSWIKYERPPRVVSMKLSSTIGQTGMRYTRLQRLHHSYVVPSSSVPDHATTLQPQPIGNSLSHVPSEGPMGALCLTHGYFGPIKSHTQVLRQEYIHTHTPPP